LKNSLISKKTNLKSLTRFLYFPDMTQILNDDSDRKKMRYPMLKINALLNKKVKFNNIENIFKTISDHDVVIFENNLRNDVANENETYKLFTSFSSNQAFATDSKSLRKFVAFPPNLTNYNHNLNLNVVSDYLNYVNKTIATDNFFFYNLSSSN